MIKNWKTIALIISLAINVTVIITFGVLWAEDRNKSLKPAYNEKEIEEFKKKVWMVKVKLDTIDIKYPAVQYAFFNYDPTSDFTKFVRNSAYIHNKLIKETDNEARKSILRLAAISNEWDKIFENISGDKIQMIIKQGMNAQTSNGKSPKLWLVTKCYPYNSEEPVCWCIPVEPEVGKEITVTFDRASSFDVGKEFDRAILEGSKEMKTAYPIKSNFKDEPAAHSLYKKMIKAFQAANALYFESTYWFGREFSGLNEVTYRMWLKKPSYVRIESASKGKVTGNLVGDGNNVWIYWGDKKNSFAGEDFSMYRNKTYKQIPEPIGIESLADMTYMLKAAIPRLSYQPSWFFGYKNELDDSLDGVRMVGNEVINGEPCTIIEVSFKKNQRSRFYWISNSDFFPRKIREVIHGDDTILQEEMWSNILINPDIPAAIFKWQPPADWEKAADSE